MVMKIYVNYILFVFLFFLLNSCGKQNNSNNKILQISSTEYLSYFLEEEIDTILSNWEKYESNSEYNNKYRQRAIRRKQEINNLKGYNVSKRKDYMPSSFKKYLLPEEIQHFNSDSISHWVVYNEIMKKRRLNLMNNIKHFHFLTVEEIQAIIKGKEKDTAIYRRLALERYTKDSISYWTAYNHKKDSLQSIIHSIDSIQPFGPKSLGELINKGQNQLSFTIPKKDSLTDRESILTRKYIFDTWLYFLKFHPYADADLGEGYIEKSLPKINTYDYIKLNDGDKIEKRLGLYDEKHGIGSLAVRISNIQSLEVYYTTTGVYGSDGKCGVYGKNEGNCCFIEDYKCNSRGHLVFYDRENQHATFIPAYELNTEWDDGLISFRFFYISEDNTIHVFEGDSRKNYQTSGHDRYYTSKSVTLSKTFEVKITEDYKFIVNKVCGNIQKEGRDSDTERSKIYRDSVFYSTKPIVSSYPFGSNTLINHSFPENEFEIELTEEYSSNKHHQEALCEICMYYSKDYNPNNHYNPLPSIEKINHINIGPIEYWAAPFNSQFLYSDCYIETSDDRNRTFDYKLPDIGKYEVFFNSDPSNTYYDGNNQQTNYNGHCSRKDGYFKFHLRGAIILYDKETKTANVINAVEVNNDSKQVNFRFFYINNNNQIKIYQGYGNHQVDLSNPGYVNEDFNTKGKYKLNKTHTVKVQENGKITIIKNN